MTFLNKLFYPFILSPDDPATGTVTTEATDKEKPSTEYSKETPKEDEKPVETPKTDPNIAAINEKIAEQTKLLNTLIEKQDEKSADSGWTIDKLEAAELKCHSGEYDIKYLPKITTMKALLTARQVAAEERTQYSKETAWETVQAKWDQGMLRAVETFGEPGDDGKKSIDPNSKLWKTAQAILHQDPGFRKYHELKANKIPLKDIDPTLIDPDGQYKAFEIAHSRLSRESKDAPNPNPSGKNGSKNALGGHSLPKGDEQGVALLDKLEKHAVDTGNPNDWIALQKEQLRQDRVRRGQR